MGKSKKELMEELDSVDSSTWLEPITYKSKVKAALHALELYAEGVKSSDIHIQHP